MRITRSVAALLAAGALAGCVSLKRTPEARFFTLRPVAERPARPASNAAGPGIVGVLPVSLPGFLERPQLVAWSAPGEVRVDEFLRWAEPLDASVPRVLAEDLETLLPSHRVIRSPWARSTTVQCRVRAELVRFGLQRGGEVALSARFVVLPAQSERPLLSRDVELRREPGRADPGGAVEAMSALVADLAEEIAKAIGTLPMETWDDALGAPAPLASR
jgi:uncharacterized lipoprotein YmbA